LNEEGRIGFWYGNGHEATAEQWGFGFSVRGRRAGRGKTKRKGSS